jgi:cytosol alanyl aminopeptidase
MELVLKPDTDLRETATLLSGPISTPAIRALPFEFVKKNYDAIVARIPSGSTFGFAENLPFVGGAFCDRQSSDDVAAFSEPRVDRFAGTRRNLAQVLEYIRICTAVKATQQASVTEFFQRY